MGNKFGRTIAITEMEGTVIGHAVSFKPGYTKEKESHVTISKPPIISALIRVLINKETGRYCDVLCRAVEVKLEMGEGPSLDDIRAVYAAAQVEHPIGEARKVEEKSEPSFKHQGQIHKRYKFVQ
jgi:hypothetical protein